MSKKPTLAEINRNPLNIRYSPSNQWKGQVSQNKGFCVFKSNSYGIRAGYIILTNYIKNGVNTIRDIVSRWAPPSENDTQRYINFVCEETILSPDMVLTDKSIDDYWTKIMILQAMVVMESGQLFDEQQINLFINYPEKYED